MKGQGLAQQIYLYNDYILSMCVALAKPLIEVKTGM